jgi:hypothetical protein
MTEEELFQHICKLADSPAKGLQPPYAPVAIPLHPNQPFDYEAAREEVCSRALGASDFIHHPSVGAPHVDVFRYPPSGDRTYWCYITNGTSDFPIQLPDGTYFRIELLAATRAISEVAPAVLHTLGKMPFEFSTFLHYYHTIPFPQGLPAEPYTFAFLIPPFLAENLRAFPLGSGQTVTLLQVIPITAKERDYAVKHGSRALVEQLPDLLSTWLFDGRARGV